MTTLAFTSIEPNRRPRTAGRQLLDPGNRQDRADDITIDVPAAVSDCDLLRAHELADRVLALEEPWAGRFVAYIASRVTFAALPDEDCAPSRARLAHWLLDRRLDALVRGLLRAWTHEDWPEGP